MTQEELDALMDDTVIDEELESDTKEEEKESLESVDDDLENLLEESSEESNEQDVENIGLEEDVDEVIDNKIDPSSATPPVVNDENRVVTQLDDVTRESEEKANEVFDKLDEILLVTSNISNSSKEQEEIIRNNIEIFEKLSDKFKDLETFKVALEDNNKLLQKSSEIVQETDKINEIVDETMNIMQYQDIHRQKIERVVNVIRALSHYMQSLFDSNVDDDKRSSSAITIDSQNSVNEDELEALLESFAKK